MLPLPEEVTAALHYARRSHNCSLWPHKRAASTPQPKRHCHLAPPKRIHQHITPQKWAAEAPFPNRQFTSVFSQGRSHCCTNTLTQGSAATQPCKMIQLYSGSPTQKEPLLLHFHQNSCHWHPLPQEMILCWDTTTTEAVSGPHNSGAKAISVHHRHSYMWTHMLDIVSRGVLSVIILPHGGKSEQKDPSSESVNSHGREGRCPQAAGGNKTASDRLFLNFLF